jgi:hypothetical protein
MVGGTYRPFAGRSAIATTLDRVGPGGDTTLDHTSHGRSAISFEFTNVPPGQYVVVIRESPDDDHDVVVTRTEQFTLAPGGEASLTCRWDDGCSVVI